jgi:aldehyde:ferredoxin oxidoreductase
MTFTVEDFQATTERIITLERAFNTREGVGMKEETLPPRMWERPTQGPHQGFRFDREQWKLGLQAYYQIHGYTPDGVPTKETCRKLGFAYVGEELERMGKYGSQQLHSSES